MAWSSSYLFTQTGDGSVDTSTLHKELLVAGLPVSGVSTDGHGDIVDEFSDPDVPNVVASAVPTITVEFSADVGSAELALAETVVSQHSGSSQLIGAGIGYRAFYVEGRRSRMVSFEVPTGLSGVGRYEVSQVVYSNAYNLRVMGVSDDGIRMAVMVDLLDDSGVSDVKFKWEAYS